MLVSKRALESIATFASAGDTRWPNGVHLAANGDLVATDGRTLGLCTHRPLMGENAFPQIGQSTGIQPPLVPCTLAIEGIRALIKTLPKKSKLDIGKSALLDTLQTNSNGHAAFYVAGEETSQHVSVVKLEGQFPPYEKVLPKDAPVYRVAIDAKLLARLVKAADALSANQQMTIIELELFRDSSQPLRATVTNDEGATLTALLMPLSNKVIDEKPTGLLVN